MTEPIKTVQLGDHRLPVVSQRHARLEHGARRLGFTDLSEYYVALAIPVGDHERRYKLLSLAVPELPVQMPLHEWCGFASQEAMDSDDYSEGADRSPTDDEIAAAGHAVVEVNGVGRLGKLLGVVQTMSSFAQQEPSQNGNSTAPVPVSPGSTGE